MTPKEKAISLYENFFYLIPAYVSDKDQDITAKFCAAKCINEILNFTTEDSVIKYFKEVKQELEKI